MIDLLAELRRIVQALDDHGIDYALCGGVALAIYGIPRATIDIDLMILPPEVERAAGALEGLGYRLRAADMALGGGAVTITRVVKRDPDSEDVLMVDVLHVTENLKQVWQGRQRVAWDRGAVVTVSRGGLVSLKRIRGSGQDLDDIRSLTGDRE